MDSFPFSFSPLFFFSDGYDEEPEGAELMLGGSKLVVHENNADDPYVTVPDHEDYDEEDDEDLVVKKSDIVICVGKTEEEASTLEVYLYEEEGGKLYVHHDFNLPSFPLSLCWMDCDPRSSNMTQSSAPTSSQSFTDSASAGKGSFLAVGTFQCGIELWNLDVLDVLEPVGTLGGRNEPDPEVVRRAVEEENKLKKKKGSKKAALSASLQAKLMGELKEGSHADAVMSLAWHPASRTRLASGSADHTVKLWDVVTQKCVTTLDSIHSNKVQALNWNYVESNVLLTGSYDQTVCVVDVRANTKAKEGVMSFKLGADIEQAKWSPHQPFLFACSLENGHVVFFDARQASKAPMFTLAAHAAPCTNLSFNAVLPSCFATASLDKTVKIWDFNPTPTLVSTKDMKPVGSIFSAEFDKNYAHVLAVGGDKGKLGIWDLREDAKCRAKYGEECDGQMGRPATQQNPFAMTPGTLNTHVPTTTPTPTESASSSSAPASKDKKKKKMKTTVRRTRDEDSD